MSSITNSYSSSLYSSYYQNLKDSNTNKTTSDSEIYVNLANKSSITQTSNINQDSKTTLPSDKEILNEINNQAQFYQQAWREAYNISGDKLGEFYKSGKDEEGKTYYWFRHDEGYRGGTTVDKWDMNFIDTIENKLKSNISSNITQQDAENAQKFLFEQMDNIMLTLYKENPELMQETMEKCNQFYAKGGLKVDLKDKDTGDEKLDALLLDYGARTESERVEEVFLNYLGNMTNSLRDYIAGEEIDYATFLDIKVNINQYRDNKMHATGYSFFAAVTDKLSPALQEQITDAIAQVMSFYSQPHSMEINGYKISWEFDRLYDDYSLIGAMGIHYPADISITFSTPNSTLTQNTFLALASNFDSSQTFFEVLEQRDKLEKENQELKNKEVSIAYGILQNTFAKTDSQSDSIMQTLLKESKEA